MSSLKHISRETVLRTLDEADAMGLPAFLAKYGYHAAKAYQIRYMGRSYPSKAILGVAGGLRPAEFFGGVAQAVPALERLGFQIRNGERVGAGIRARALPLDVAAYFASGSNRVGEIRGLGELGHDIGTVAGELNAEALEELELLAGTDVQIFVDSGAFSGTPDWDKVLGLYIRLAKVLGNQLWVVAPDVVGDQEATLELLERFHQDLFDLNMLGARVIVPLQKGQLDLSAFYCVVLGTLDFAPVPGLPCKKAATTLDEAKQFFANLDAWRLDEPGAVHLLGMGPKNRLADEFVAAAGDRAVTMDSNWIRANVGRGPRPRAYTAARDLVAWVKDPANRARLALLIALGSWG